MDKVIKELFGEDAVHIDPRNRRMHVFIGLNGEILYASRNHGCILGYGDEIIGMNVRELLHEGDQQTLEQNLKLIKYGPTEGRVKHKKGYYVKMVSDSFPIPGVGVAVFAQPLSKKEE